MNQDRSSARSVVFRPTVRYWFNEVIGTMLLLLAGAAAMLVLDPEVIVF